MLILIGAELVRSLETFRYEGHGNKLTDLLATLMVLWHCRQLQQQGNTLSDQYIVHVGLDAEHWKRLRNGLLQQSVLEKTVLGHCALIRDLGTITLTDMAGCLGENLLSSPQQGADKLLSSHPWHVNYELLITKNRTTLDNIFLVTVEALFNTQQMRT